MNITKKALKSLSLSIALGCTLSVSAAEALIDTNLQKAVGGEHRSAKNIARDAYRNPVETLSFFGFKSNMTVVEVAPGSGWYTEVLAPALKPEGQYYAAFYPDSGDDGYYSRTRRSFEEKIASSDLYSKVLITNFTPRTESQIAPNNSADLVLTFRNLHNWKNEGVLQLFKDAHKALKANGVLGVVEHRMPADQKWQDNQKSGYFPTATTIQLAKEAGFTLAASSEINANPKDTANHPKGVWTLPPVLRLGEQDKEKYLAIGESDRMTLKFIKSKN